MLTLDDHKRLRGEIAHEDLMSMVRWLQAAGVQLQTGREVLEQLDALEEEHGEADLIRDLGTREVLFAWTKNRMVYSRACMPHLDLWRNRSGEARQQLEEAGAWDDEVREVQTLDADTDAAPDPEPYVAPAVDVPRRPTVFGPGPYDGVTMPEALKDTPETGIRIPDFSDDPDLAGASDAFQEVLDRAVEDEPAVLDTAEALDASMASMREAADLKRRERIALAAGAGEAYTSRSDTKACELCYGQIRKGELIAKCAPRDGAQSTSRRMHMACVEKWRQEVAV